MLILLNLSTGGTTMKWNYVSKVQA